MKAQLQRISSILQYLSFEAIEDMLHKMKSLQLKKIQTEFIMLTMHHGAEALAKLDAAGCNENVKTAVGAQIEEFIGKLVELSGFEHPDVAFSAVIIKEAQAAKRHAAHKFETA